ncbi:MAG TPA: response regulator [Puia sp.]|nr:response regulator [Puia sp.]
MKRFYIIFFAVCVLFATVLYFSVWWIMAGLAVSMIYIAYRFYAVRMGAIEARNAGLEVQVEALHVQLDSSILKEQRTTREVGQIKEARQQLMAILSHEIRTPMNGIMGMSILLSETPLTKEQGDYAATIRTCSETLLMRVNDILVNDILQFVKFDQNGVQLENKDFDLRNCIDEVLEMFSMKTAAAGVELIGSIDPDVPEQVTGDSRKLRQVLMNLLENSVRFTVKGEIFVGVHLLRTLDNSKAELSFEVRDTGAGIPAVRAEQIFNGIPGKESGDAGAEDSKGLGLVICKKLVEMMDGWIAVQSEPKRGSTFTFAIPFPISQRPGSDHLQRDLIASLKNKHVLIVDDNPTSRDVLLKQLLHWKLLPVGAGSGEQALSLLASDPGFDLVLTDLDMPGMDGVLMAKTIREKYPAMPVILMNSPGDDRYQQDSELFISVLTRPVRQYMLRDHILGIFAHSLNPLPDKQLTMNLLSVEFSTQYPLHILIAEDNLINQKIAVKILTKLGYQPALARNGKEVLEMVSHEHYDMILMDVQMPEMDGFEATRMLRSCLEIQPVIIAMTANAMQGDRNDCIQAGMDDYISKPISMKELLAQLEKWALVIKSKKQTTLLQNTTRQIIG